MTREEYLAAGADRSGFLNALIGKPWQANAKGPDAYDCWHLGAKVEDVMFGRKVPLIEVPENPSWKWMINTFDAHPERKNWVEVQCDPMGVVRAADGAIVLMARVDRPAHAGIWLKGERRIIHAHPIAGVVFDEIATIRATGWMRLRYFEPRT